MNRRTILKGGLVLAATAHTAALTPALADPLLEVGQRFEAAYAIEEAARVVGQETDDWTAWDEAYAATSEIVKEIEMIPASSIDGMRVKARCIQWCYGDDPVELYDSGTTDVRLANQIVASLLKI